MRSPLALAACALLAAAVLVGRPAGLGLAVTAWALIAVAARPRDAWPVAFWAGAAALAGVAALRTAPWVVWPALATAAALASLAASGGATWRQLAAGVARIARLDGALAVMRPVATARPRGDWRSPALGAVIGGVLLAIFIPLFASADAAFAHLLSTAMPDEPVSRPFARAAVFLAVLAAGAGLLWAAAAGVPRAGEGAGAARLARLSWAPPLIALVALFAGFVALQLTTLYGGDEHVLRTAGLSYAQYAREGFAQLIAAAALTLAVIAAGVRWAPAGRLRDALLGALCALTLVVLASALTRLGLYEEAYGFTRLRLAAHGAILWLGGLFVLVLAAGLARRAGWLPRAAVAFTGLAVLAFALADPDRRIAEHNVDRYERTGKLDEDYLAELSLDAAPALARLPDRLAGCATASMERELARPDGLAGLNLARSRARAALPVGTPCVR